MHKLAICLALCCLMGSSSIGANRLFEPPSRLSGITFSAPETSGEERRQTSENELRRVMLQTDSNAETAARYVANKEEVLRRARLNRILDAIGASLAPASAQASGQQQVAEPAASPRAPLHRKGRIYPSSRDTNENARNFRLAGSASEYQGAANAFDRARADSVERWEPSMLDGGSSSAKSQRSSPIKGLVWPSNRPINSNGSPPFYSSLKLGGNGADGGPQPSNIYGVNQQRTRSGQLLAGSGAGSGAQSQHDRLGNSEEIAIQTPVHSRANNDYEWKRVEQSRWNNLRGMWGKRAAMRDDEDPADKYKELIEWEAQQEAAQRAGEPGQDAYELAAGSKAIESKQQEAHQQSSRSP